MFQAQLLPTNSHPLDIKLSRPQHYSVCKCRVDQIENMPTALTDYSITSTLTCLSMVFIFFNTSAGIISTANDLSKEMQAVLLIISFTHGARKTL